MGRRARGEGAVYQRHDHETCPPLDDAGERPDHKCRGRWVTTIDYGVDIHTRKRDRKTLYGKTKSEVIKKREAALKKAPAKRSGQTYTVATWLTEWLDQIAAPTLKPQTLASHRSKVNAYLIPLLGKNKLERLTAAHIRHAYTRLRQDCPDPNGDGTCPHSPSHGLSEATIRQAHAILSRALKVAEREGHVPTNEAKNVDPPSTKQNQRARLTTAQAELVLAAATKRPHPSRWFAALEMGIRQGEALGLPWAFVDLDAATVTISRTLEKQDGGLGWGTPKSEAGARTIPIFARTLAHLRVERARYLQQCEERGEEPDPLALVWSQGSGKPINPKSDWNAWAQLLKDAGVPHVTLHSARQTAAARMEEQGVPERLAAEYLGHSNVSMTYRYQRGAGVENLRRVTAIEPPADA